MSRRLASATLVLALLPGCGYARDFIAWRNDRGAKPAPAERPEALDLEARTARMRETRARAWDRVAKGDPPDGYEMADALALSKLARALDVRASWDRVPAAGRATLADLPRGAWWYVFTPPRAWSRGPLAVDRARRPGHYAAMMDAMAHVIARARLGGSPPTAEAYLELHRLATFGVFDREREAPIEPGFAHEPGSYTVAALHDLASLQPEHLAQALSELKADGLAGWNAGAQRDRAGVTPPAWLGKILGAHEDVNPHNKPTELVYRRAQGARGIEEWLVGTSTFHGHEAQRWAAQWLDAYAHELQQVTARTPDEYFELLAAFAPAEDAKVALAVGAGSQPGEELLAAVRPIARLVRRMQVSHLFCDRAEAVDTVLLLNYLLTTRGLPPAIVDDPSMFGGREPIAELATEIVKGQRRFQALVRELAARETSRPADTSVAGI